MITSKQRAKLRSMANGLSPIVHVGKGGISDNLIEQLDGALETRELVKITILQSCDEDARVLCDTLAKKLGAEPVQAIGKKFVLYRESKDHKKIEL